MIMIEPYSRWATISPPVVPKLYWNAYSQEERIKRICMRIHSIEGYLNYLQNAMQEFEAEIRGELEKLLSEVRTELDLAIADMRKFVEDNINDMREWVEAQTLSMNVWDVTTGSAISSVEAMRRLFIDVTVHGTTVQELADSSVYDTVQELANSGWNVRALAVIGAQVLDAPNPEQWQPTGAAGDAFDAGRLSIARVDEDGFVVV